MAKPTSLHRRVSLAVVGVTSSVVLVASLALFFITESILVRGVDRELLARAERLQNFDPLSDPDTWRNLNNNHEMRRRIERGGPNEMRRVFLIVFDRKNGNELHRSPSLPAENDLALTLSTFSDKTPNKPETHVLSNGQSARMLLLRIHKKNRDERERRFDGPRPLELSRSNNERDRGDDKNERRPPSDRQIAAIEPNKEPDKNNAGDGVIALIGLDLGQVRDELERIAVVLLSLWTGATLLAFASIKLLQPTVLRPARDLASAIAQLGPDDLTRRLPPDIGPQELRAVVERLNSLFASLEHAFKREQATIANIAHELRTPVAALRSALEFRQMASANDDEQHAIRGYLATVERMQSQVSNLLLLARLESGKEPLQKSAVEMDDLIDEAIDRWSGRAAEKKINIDVAEPCGATVVTSPDHVGLILDNLLSNALAHGAAPIQIACHALSGRVEITLRNNFVGKLDEQQLGQAYYRGDSARTGDDHCGLGLALCQRLSHLLGAQLELRVEAQQFIATLSLPCEAKTDEADKLT
jgi:signal transduction histidine kinase